MVTTTANRMREHEEGTTCSSHRTHHRKIQEVYISSYPVKIILDLQKRFLNIGGLWVHGSTHDRHSTLSYPTPLPLPTKTAKPKNGNIMTTMADMRGFNYSDHDFMPLKIDNDGDRWCFKCNRAFWPGEVIDIIRPGTIGNKRWIGRKCRHSCKAGAEEDPRRQQSPAPRWCASVLSWTARYKSICTIPSHSPGIV